MSLFDHVAAVTGVPFDKALRLARGLDLPETPEQTAVVEALREGWTLAERVEAGEFDPTPAVADPFAGLGEGMVA